jgi:ribosomal protein L17
MARGQMSPEHKEALARGRQQAKVVRHYLEALHSNGQRGRPVDRQSLEGKIERLQGQIDEEPNAARRVELIQERLDSERRLAGLEESADREALERDFIAIAKEYSQRRGITYTAWREVGVPAAVLREAGIARGRADAGT